MDWAAREEYSRHGSDQREWNETDTDTIAVMLDEGSRKDELQGAAREAGVVTYTRSDLRISDVPTVGRILSLLALVLLLQRAVSLPRLMRVFDSRGNKGSDDSFDVNRVLWLTKGVLRRLFGSRYCMKRSLILFRYLRRNGRDARIVFGVARDGGELKGHAWVTVDGHPFSEEGSIDQYAVTYAYPEPEHEVQSKDQ